MPDEFVEKIEKIEAGEESKASTEAAPRERIAADKERFDTLMRPEKGVAEGGKVSLMDAVREFHHPETKTGAVSREGLIAQTEEAVTKIEGIKQTLETPQLTIKNSVQQLLQDKLTHIDENLKVALSKAGVEIPGDEEKLAPPLNRVNPVERFLHFLTDGQYQLQHLGEELRVMGLNKQELSPVNMLAVQVKVGQIQQELELFSSLLNKTLESIKTIMNIQV